LMPIAVYGRGGQALHQRWRDGADAYLGLAVPGFPNAFLIAGPNSFNPAGSNPGMKEHQIAFIIECLRWRREIGAPAVEVTEMAMRRYRRWLGEAISHTVWPTSASWYRHPSGRVTNPWPASVRTFARMLRRPPAEPVGPLRLAPVAAAAARSPLGVGAVTRRSTRGCPPPPGRPAGIPSPLGG